MKESIYWEGRTPHYTLLGWGHLKHDRIKKRTDSIDKHRKPNKKVKQAINLPKVMNLNPRSAMNKLKELENFIDEEEIDLAFISESHKREDKKLEDNINLDKLGLNWAKLRSN